MTYAISFRRHVLAVKEREGLTFAQAAARFSVGIASLVRWSGKLEPKASHRQRGLKIDLEKLAQDVRERHSRSILRERPSRPDFGSGCRAHRTAEAMPTENRSAVS